MADGGTTPRQVEDFITHWAKAEASERTNAQPFLTELALALDPTVGKLEAANERDESLSRFRRRAHLLAP